MDVLLLGVDSHAKSFLRKHLEVQAAPKARLHSCALEDNVAPQNGHWDLIIVGGAVQSHPELTNLIKKDRVQGLKIILTERENLHSAFEFWGTKVYSYLLKPLHRELFQLLWQNAVERVELSKRVSRLRKQRDRQRAGVFEQQEVLKDLFISHLKMQELNQEKNSFLARTSHELLSPLTALHGYLEVVAHGKAGAVNELQSRVLNSSLESCQRLIRLAKSLTDLVALDQDLSMSFLHLESGDIQECLLRARSELNGRIEANGLLLTMETDPAVPRFQFDFDRMQQVFVNLMENAAKYTPAGGSIHVRCASYFWERRTVREMIYGEAERRRHSSPSGFNSVRITVADTGVGIPAEFLHDIFEEYSRAANGNGSPRGFGLGLAVTRRIVLAHQGKIWAESAPGQGSTFTVLIPLSE